MTATTPQQNNRKLLLKLLGGVVFMFGFCYMLVPLYSLVCKQTGINGKYYGAAASDNTSGVDLSRTITVQFMTTLHGDFGVEFKPLANKITLHPGENKEVYFYAQNNNDHDITVQAIPSFSPGIAAKYLRKTECFCFTQQTLLKGEKAEMPVVFYVDRDLDKNIDFISLNYTLFDASHYIKNVPHFTKGRIDIT